MDFSYSDNKANLVTNYLTHYAGEIVITLFLIILLIPTVNMAAGHSHARTEYSYRDSGCSLILLLRGIRLRLLRIRRWLLSLLR